ncbi:hypothetical protein A5621_10475 [Mycobacterium colombiense]|nr:hypothetical protein A5620_04025 [Mycobacterium colombiense]OBJ40791.1 hypothetical protein A5621_10475 [Mycobacterium colombiense]
MVHQSPEKAVRPNRKCQPTMMHLMNQAIKGRDMITLPTTTIQAPQTTSRRMTFRQWTITLGSDIEI